MIFSAYHYSCQFSDPLVFQGDTFSPCKYFEMFPLWYQYLRKSYPNEHICLFFDGSSKIPLEKAFPFIGEPYEIVNGPNFRPDVRFHIKPRKIGASPPYDHQQPIREVLFDAVLCASALKEDLLWIDQDCLFNTRLYPKIGCAEVWCPEDRREDLMMDTFLFYVSQTRIQEIAQKIDLPKYFSKILAHSTVNTKMRFSQEWGFYQLFCFGDVSYEKILNAIHSGDLRTLIRFLKRNPLGSAEYSFFLEKMLDFETKSALWPFKIRVDFQTFYREDAL